MLLNDFRTLKLTLVIFGVFCVCTPSLLHAETEDVNPPVSEEPQADALAPPSAESATSLVSVEPSPTTSVDDAGQADAVDGAEQLEEIADESADPQSLASVSDEPSDQATNAPKSLNDQVQSLKNQVLELNKDLFILEEELLFPSETQLAVYVSLDVGHYFRLDAVKLSVDGDVVSSYLYTDRQVDALKRGGIQRLYMGNIRSGEHELVAVFTGLGPNGEDYRRASELTFSKDDDVKHIELKIVDSTAIQQPEFIVKEW